MLIDPMAVALNTSDIQTTICKKSDFKTLKNLSGASKEFYNKVHREFLERFFFNPATQKSFVINDELCRPTVVCTVEYIQKHAKDIKDYTQIIKVLSIFNCNFSKFPEESEYSLKSLAVSFPNVEKLVLNQCTVKDDSCCFESFTNLKNLHLIYLRLTYNIYKNNPLLSLSFIKKLPSLKELNLDGTYSKDESLITYQNFIFSCSGNRYEGRFEKGELQGQGKKTRLGGDLYEGNFEKGELQGQGKLTLSNRSLYEGNFEKGELQGQGKLTTYDGSLYEGEFRNGKMHGQGKYSRSNKNPIWDYPGSLAGSFYEGEFENGIMHGQGTLTYSNGDRYVGDFEKNELHGQGTLTYSNGDRYEGAFYEGSLHGKGKYTHRNGTIEERSFFYENVFFIRIEEGLPKSDFEDHRGKGR